MKLPDFRDVASASRQVATQSAMNPILWQAAICTPAGMICSALAPAPISYFILALSAVPIVVGAWGVRFFAKRDANRLQSEAHVENMSMISRIGDNETARQVLISRNSPISGNSSEEDAGE